MTIDFCTADFYLLKSSSHLVGSIIIVAAYIVAEIFCVISCLRTIKKVNAREDAVLIPLMVTLNITIVFRIFYFLGGVSPFCYKAYWYFFFSDIASLSKDICLMCLLIRVWEYLGSLKARKTRTTITGDTHISLW